MKIRVLFILAVIIICAALAAFILSGCTSDFMWHRPPWPPWPSEYSGIFSKFITDPADDLGIYWPDQPTYPVSYPPVDVTQLSFGVQGHYFYIRIDYVGVIPTAPVDIAEDPPIEAQTVSEHGTLIAMNIDNDGMTGVNGIEVFYLVGFKYGQGIPVGGGYNLIPGTEDCQNDVWGEFGEGGPGHNYIIVRYNLEKLGSFFPRGSTVQIEWASEALSVDSSGAEFYHHFAVDALNFTTLTLP